jgi:polyketide synthase PksN
VIKEECKNPGDALIRYQSGKRYIMGWSELETPDRELVIPWKNGGIYLITGGVGGLGLVFAEEIAAKTKGSNLILTGRTGLSEDKKTKIENLKALGANIIYRQTDVTDSEAVDNLIKGIKSEFGRLDGIMHCAGIIRDNLIIKKDEEEFKEVLAPKVTGLLNLDEASKNMKLDFFIIFSSISACFGNVGQADYSTANAFMDAYAGYRSGLVESGHRSGVTLSFNWPLWQDGGMQIDSVTKRNMMQRGLMPMKSVSGINALYHAMDSGRDRILVIEGKVELIRKHFFQYLMKMGSMK